jgi:putative aldouronate transport system permease protein
MKRKIDGIDIGIWVFCGLFTLLCFYPIYNVLINTISDNQLVQAGKVLLYPEGIHFKNFEQLFRMKSIYRATMVSVGRTVIGTFISVICTSFMGYAVTRPELWKRKFWYRLIIVTMYFSSGIIPGYLLMYNLKLINNPLVYVVGGFAPAAFSMILVKTYIESLSPALDESAEIDGAGYMRRFLQIMVPLCKPIIATLTVFAAVGQWNAVMDTVLYMPNEQWHTLQYILYSYLRQADRLASQIRSSSGNVTADMLKTTITAAGVRYTITAVTIIPILMVYPFLQRYFVKGIMIGAIKG